MTETAAVVPRQRRPVVGLLLAIVAAAALTAFASVAPVGLRKLVLFAVGFGLAVGWIVAWAAREFGLPRMVSVVLAAVLVPAGLGWIALRSHQSLRDAQRQAAQDDPQQMMSLRMLENAAGEDPELRETLDRRRREIDPGFTDYLATRVAPLGEWREPWPVVFWIGEILLATVAGVYVVCRRIERRRDTLDQSASLSGRG